MNKRIRLGFIGVGGRGGKQAAHVDKNFADRVDIAALAHVNTENMDRCSNLLESNTPELYTRLASNHGA